MQSLKKSEDALKEWAKHKGEWSIARYAGEIVRLIKKIDKNE